MESFTGIFADSLGLKGNLTSCESELKELMHQIDVMVSAKKTEWENHMHAVQIQLEKRNKELGFTKAQLEQKNHEVDRLKHNVKEMERGQRSVIDEYEQHVIRLKEEVDNMKYEHEKLQKKSGKQTIHVEKERDQLMADLKLKDSEILRLNARLEECKAKAKDFEGARHIYEERLNALEGQKNALLEKSDLNQQQILGYQTQLNKRRHMLEDLEHDHQKQQRDLQEQIKRLKEETEAKEDTISELKDTLDSALSGGRQQASEVAQLQEDLRIALDAIQQLEDDNNNLKIEIQSRDNLIQAAEQDQMKHSDDIMKLEHSLVLKDEVIRQYEGENSRSENKELQKLKDDLRTTRIEIQSHADNEAFLREELNHANKKMQDGNKMNSKLQSQLSKREEELKRLKEEEIQGLLTEIARLQEKLHSVEQGHVGAVHGMQTEVQSLASELHKRDSSMADVSERIQRMEKDLRNATGRYDSCAAELQVTNAQLEALRLENKHLRDSAHDQLDLSDVYKGNLEFIAQVENENRELRMEVLQLREELSVQQSNQQNQVYKALTNSETRQREQLGNAERKIAALQSRLDATINNYEAQIHFLKSENRKMTNSRLSSGKKGKGRQEPGHTSNSEYTDTDALTYADLGGPNTVENSGGNMGSRRTSLTADFISDENRREKELQQILDGRIADLKADTDLIIKKYT